MSVWLCIPSARPANEAKECLDSWKAMGYKIALWIDDYRERANYPDAVLASGPKYPGYARAVNTLIAHVMSVVDPQAEWFVTGGDDVWPDQYRRPEDIASECYWHFGGPPIPLDQPIPGGYQSRATFGVMQPTGDRWHEGKGGFTNAPIDRVCGSPWLGREFCRRINQGLGPLWCEYRHMFVDEELQNVAEKYGVLWQRPDLRQEHRHWGRGATDDAILNDPKIPEHLEKWNTSEHWQSAKAIFQRRKQEGFPGSEPIA